ncbi:alanine racemase, partial [Kyrpidia sp.]|uniref:alanine racemase n=1 Tax=Kyrpidia sp. TaxID=2073077 RepID=UPI002588DA4B
MEERETRALNGFLGLLAFIILVVGAVLLLPTGPFWSIVLAVMAVLVVSGFFIVQPNEAKVLIFFGRYLGTAKKAGFWWTIPFTNRKRLSLRVRNFNSAKLKVNDVDGNPIEIAAVVVFRVVNSAKAVFDVDKYEEFVEIQSETALRHIASQYPYDLYREEGYSLRGNSEEVAGQLKQELQERLAVALLDREHLQEIEQTNLPQRLAVHIKVDTGMGRLGTTPEALHDLLEDLEGARNIIVAGVFSHFGNADRVYTEFCQGQLRRFREVVGWVKQRWPS